MEEVCDCTDSSSKLFTQRNGKNFDIVRHVLIAIYFTNVKSNNENSFMNADNHE